MSYQDAERSPIGRTALGGAACGFTYDGALQDAVAREDRLRRPLRLARWQDDARRVHPYPATMDQEPARSDASA